MDFKPPDPADLDNVYSLNNAYLELAITASRRAPWLDVRLPEMVGGFAGLEPQVLQRLARTPFLLFSLGENDMRRWRAVFDHEQGADRIKRIDSPDPAEARIVQAALGFLWQLVKKRPYAGRVVSGATYQWCERLALCTLVELFEFAAIEPRLLVPRMATNANLWRKLFISSSSDQSDLRAAARFSALQAILTTAANVEREKLPVAACNMPTPRSRVADRTLVSQSTARGYNTPPDESALDKEPD